MQHPIQVVVRRTGLTADAVRVWERRYGAVTPDRGGNNERLYSESDIQRLNLLRQATDHGFRIGRVAGLADAELATLVAEAAAAEPNGHPVAPADGPGAALVAAALGAIEGFDARGLHDALDRATLDLGDMGTVQHVVAPLLEITGSQWRAANLRMAHEHLASAVLRTFLGQLLLRAAAGRTVGPTLVVCCPAGQWHELGALMAATVAAMAGWQVVYLGASLPAEEAAYAAVRCGARGLALGLTYPADDSALPEELRRLQQRLPDGIPLLAGGAACKGYEDVLAATGATVFADLAGFGDWLDRQRSGGTA